MNYLTYREKYKQFIYESFNVSENETELIITYKFVIPNLEEFNPSIKILKSDITNKKLDYKYIDYLAFNIGLVELISYWKCVCSKEIIVKCGYLDKNQKNWFKKLYFYGLGEFFYTNNIEVDIDNFVDIKTDNNKLEVETNYQGEGNLILVGGGKDSVVSMELLKGNPNSIMMVNPKKTMLYCVDVAGYKDITSITRVIDKKLIELNKQGFLNGHTPFSALLAFTSFLVAYLKNKKYIVLSNESSANEGNVVGNTVNHQYSKSYEFENDFNYYVDNYFQIDIKYFSFLRPLNELQIAHIFSKYKKYHNVFKSCNVGSKKEPWEWCCNCSKCLFVYIILNPFLEEQEMINMFGENLLDKDSLLEVFKQLIGDSENKPFDCVGTFEEINYALKLSIKKQDKLPYLLNYYYQNHSLIIYENLLNRFNNSHNLEPYFLNIIRGALDEK
ncbi:MAG: hypothetical protein PHU94_03425 [Bacilli bacterium]|nr:hypothetical protein [Bacilli bacterium]MDD4733862.1 hypothetical protein [Bacilli bacterium]